MTLSIRTARARRARQVDGGRGAAACERTAIDYARNLLVGARFDRAARARGLENLDDDDIARAALRTIYESLGSSPAMESKKLWEQFRRFMARGRPPLVRPAALDEPLQSNLRLVGEVIGLDELETELFQFFAVLRLVHPLVEITDVAGALSLLGASEVCGAAVARPREEVMAVLSPKGRLVGSGLLTVEDDPANLSYKLQIHGGLVDLLIIPGLQRQQLYDTLLPVAPEPTLDVDDYPHLAEEVALARRIIEGALRARRPGVNVLLYGRQVGAGAHHRASCRGLAPRGGQGG